MGIVNGNSILRSRFVCNLLATLFSDTNPETPLLLPSIDRPTGSKGFARSILNDLFVVLVVVVRRERGSKSHQILDSWVSLGDRIPNLDRSVSLIWYDPAGRRVE